MTSIEIETLRWQFDLVWRLAQYHLPALTDEASLWEPIEGAWTVRRSIDEAWRPDWADIEPEPAPAVTIGWITWQMIWWWSGLLAKARGAVPPAREHVTWPGSTIKAVAELEMLAHDWKAELARLNESDLQRPFSYPWNEPRPYRIAIAWANGELMKNVAEIGILRHIYEASRLRR